MKEQKECGLCKSVGEHYRLVAENDHAVSVVIYSPVNATHQMILPKKHITTPDQMTPDEAKSLWDMCGLVQQRLLELYTSEEPIKLSPVISINGGLAQTQLHFHLQAYVQASHARHGYANSHEPDSSSPIGVKRRGEWKDSRTHPTTPCTEKDNPKTQENLEFFLGRITTALRGTGDLEQDRAKLKELTHAILRYNKTL